MKVLNEKGKKTRQIALMNLNVGNKKEKEAARRFLLDIGLSSDTIDDLEGKSEVEESTKEICKTCDGTGRVKIPFSKIPDTERLCPKCKGKGKIIKESVINEEHIIKGINSDKEAQEMIKRKGISFNRIDRDSGDKVIYIMKDYKDKELEIGYYIPSKKMLVITDKKKTLKEEIMLKVNSIMSAKSYLKAKNINFDDMETIDNETKFKLGDKVVGVWNPSWGNVRTGKDI